MILEVRLRAVLRWLLIPVVVFMVVWGCLRGVVGLLLSPLPKELFDGMVAWTLAVIWVVPSVMLVPRLRSGMAIVLGVIGMVVNILLFGLNGLATLAGALVAVGSILWWRNSTKSKEVKRIAVTGVACAVFFLIALSRYFDYPAFRDPLDPVLVQQLGDRSAHATRFYHYEMGGFIDTQYLWRLDAEDETVRKLVNGLELLKTMEVRPEFWRMPPLEWPGGMPAGAEAFASSEFPASGRGADGTHYLLLHDKVGKRALIWVLDNF